MPQSDFPAAPCPVSPALGRCRGSPPTPPNPPLIPYPLPRNPPLLAAAPKGCSGSFAPWCCSEGGVRGCPVYPHPPPRLAPWLPCGVGISAAPSPGLLLGEGATSPLPPLTPSPFHPTARGRGPIPRALNSGLSALCLHCGEGELRAHWSSPRSLPPSSPSCRAGPALLHPAFLPLLSILAVLLPGREVGRTEFVGRCLGRLRGPNLTQMAASSTVCALASFHRTDFWGETERASLISPSRGDGNCMLTSFSY